MSLGKAVCHREAAADVPRSSFSSTNINLQSASTAGFLSFPWTCYSDFLIDIPSVNKQPTDHCYQAALISVCLSQGSVPPPSPCSPAGAAASPALQELRPPRSFPPPVPAAPGTGRVHFHPHKPQNSAKRVWRLILTRLALSDRLTESGFVFPRRAFQFLA